MGDHGEFIIWLHDSRTNRLGVRHFLQSQGVKTFDLCSDQSEHVVWAFLRVRTTSAAAALLWMRFGNATGLSLAIQDHIRRHRNQLYHEVVDSIHSTHKLNLTALDAFANNVPQAGDRTK